MDRIAKLPIEPPLKLVLIGLARHGDWNTLDHCAPTVDTLAAWTYPAGAVDARGRPVSRRLIQSALHTLGSGINDLEPTGGKRCDKPHLHLGLIIKTAPATSNPWWQPAEYRLNLPPDGVQAHFPELGTFTVAAAAAAIVDPAAIWEDALAQLAGQVSQSNYDTWLGGTAGLRFAGGVFTVGTPSAFAADWLDKRLRPLIGRTLGELLHLDEVDVAFEAAATGAERAS